MFVQTAGSKLILKCKDCHRLVTDSETNSYRLIAGVLYGWCDECFKDRPSERTASQNAAATRCQDQGPRGAEGQQDRVQHAVRIGQASEK
jgi:hypothetical protein